MKAPRSSADGVSSYTNNVYYIAASCGELDLEKCLCLSVSVCGQLIVLDPVPAHRARDFYFSSD
jgi:hypothetical protein